MKNISLIAFAVITLLSIVATAEDKPLIRAYSSYCNLDDYINAYNERNPEKELFYEDVAKKAVEKPGSPPLVQIDHDVVSARMAMDVINCMMQPVGIGSWRVGPNIWETTLQTAYQRYFEDRKSRRAMWLFFQMFDENYLSDPQRTEAVMKRESYWVNMSDGAYYGGWAISVAVLIATKKLQAAPVALARATPGAAGSVVNGVAHAAQALQPVKWSMRIRQGVKNAALLVAYTVPAGAAIGGPLYYARKYGFIETHGETTADIIERNYHRMHWLEVDCRARKLELALPERKYEKGADDPQFKRDVVSINHLINDLNFLIDVSTMYYVETDLSKDIKWTANSASYKDTSIQCPEGFSKADLSKITSNDVRQTVSNASLQFLKIYSTYLLGPISAEWKKFLTDHKAELAKAFTEKADKSLQEFFTTVQERSNIYSTSKPEKVLEVLSSYIDIEKRLDGRDAIYNSWNEFLKAIPEATLKEMNKLTQRASFSLPAALLNQLVLEQFSQTETFPGNYLMLFQMGADLEAGVKKEMITNKELFIFPNELMFNLYGNFKK